MRSRPDHIGPRPARPAGARRAATSRLRRPSPSEVLLLWAPTALGVTVALVIIAAVAVTRSSGAGPVNCSPSRSRGMPGSDDAGPPGASPPDGAGSVSRPMSRRCERSGAGAIGCRVARDTHQVSWSRRSPRR